MAIAKGRAQGLVVAEVELKLLINHHLLDGKLLIHIY